LNVPGSDVEGEQVWESRDRDIFEELINFPHHLMRRVSLMHLRWRSQAIRIIQLGPKAPLGILD